MIKLLLPFFITTIATGSLRAQPVSSNVYAWDKAPVVKHNGYEERTLMTGSTRDFFRFAVRGITRLPNQPKPAPQQLTDETLVIVKEGELTLTLDGKTKMLGPGSVVLIRSGDRYQLENKSARPLTYYLMQYQASHPPTSDTVQSVAKSFWVDWNDVAYQPHLKGGIRRTFDCATPMTKRFEMHVTTLNSGLWSHPPHTHRAAEILLPFDNSAQESIDGVLHPAGVGDVIFLESNVPHAIRNISAVSCTYFALQFE